MTNQLLLIDSRPDWRLDRATRAQGLEGIANARAVLRAVDAKRAAEAAAMRTEIDVSSTPAEQAALPLPDAA